MREIKDITKREFLEVFNKLRFIWGQSVDLKELAGALGVFDSDLKRHFRDKILIKIKDYNYTLNRDNTRIKRFRGWK